MTWINLVEDMPEKSSRCIPFEFEVKKDDLPEARSGGAWVGNDKKRIG